MSARSVGIHLIYTTNKRMFGVATIPPKARFSEQFGKDTPVVYTLICSYE